MVHPLAPRDGARAFDISLEIEGLMLDGGKKLCYTVGTFSRIERLFDYEE